MTRKMMLSFAVAVATFTAGCSQHGHSAKPSGSGKEGGGKTEEHVHGAGPNGGIVFDLGKFHAEFTVDHGKQEATIYILGSDEKTATPIAADKLDLTIKTPAFTVELKPVPMVGETGGKSSRFVGKHEKFGTEQEFEGTVIAVIGGKSSEGSFKEEPEPKK